jgi:hypothetical protein
MKRKIPAPGFPLRNNYFNNNNNSNNSMPNNNSNNTVKYERFARLIIKGSGLYDWIYWHFIAITINYKSSRSMTVSYSLNSLLDHECLLFYCDWLGSDWRVGHFFTSVVRWLTLHSWTLNIWNPLRINQSRMKAPLRLSRVESYVTTDGQSVSLSWNKAPIWGLRPDFWYCQTVAGLLMWGALSD